MSDLKDLTYVSFALPNVCLGVCVLEGYFNAFDAAVESHRLEINPGGEVAAFPFSKGQPDIPEGTFEVMQAHTNRLIPPQEARDLFEAKSIREHRLEGMN